jgi:hypothetical protein
LYGFAQRGIAQLRDEATSDIRFVALLCQPAHHVSRQAAKETR